MAKVTMFQISHCKRASLLTYIFDFNFAFDRCLQYVNKAAGSVRSALKEPMKSKLMAQSEFQYNASAWESGVQGAKKQVTSLGQAGK